MLTADDVSAGDEVIVEIDGRDGWSGEYTGTVDQVIQDVHRMYVKTEHHELRIGLTGTGKPGGVLVDWDGREKHAGEVVDFRRTES